MENPVTTSPNVDVAEDAKHKKTSFLDRLRASPPEPAGNDNPEASEPLSGSGCFDAWARPDVKKN